MGNCVKITDIHPNPKNPRLIKGDKFKKLVQSLKDFPEMTEVREIVVNKDHIILGGNMRYKAMLEAGWTEAPVKVVDWSQEKQDEFVIKDNVAFGEMDWDAIANEWSELPLEDWGLDLPVGFGDEEVEEDEAPEVSSEPAISKLGEIYQLGRHRVMCGDSTDAGNVALLMNGVKADMVFTDPPYGMNAVSNSGVLSKTYGTDIMGDDNIDAAKDSFVLCQQLFPNAMQIWWGANYYSEVLPSSECWIVWNKNNGGSDQTDAELAWCNARSVVRMFTQSSEKTNRVHPTQKPVELSAWSFKKFDSGNNVLDLFLGSGSTLIACEQTNRICYGMELDPKYVDVIRKRYWKFTHNNNEEGWEDGTPAIGV